MAGSSQISKLIKNLLAPGEYAKAAKKAVAETDAERLARLAKTQPIIDKATAAQDRIKLRELLETRVKDNPSPENIRMLEEFNEKFYGTSPSKVIEESSKSKIIPSKRKPLKDKQLDSFQETLETRVRENPTPDNIEVLDNFRKKRQAGEYPDLSQALKVAGLTGAIGVGSSLMPDEAEASPATAAKKAALELFHATRGAFEGDKLKAGSDKLIHFGSKEQAASRFDELLKQNKVSSGAQTIPVLADIKNPVELSDLNDWTANKIFRDMKKRGIINEQQAQEIVDSSRATGKQWGNDIDKDALFEYMQNKLGYDAIKYKNTFEASEADKILAASKINPDMAKIPELRTQKASLEAQLLDESGNMKPSSRETDKIHDQINKLDKQLRPLQNKLQSTFEQGAEYSYAVPEKHGGILKSKLSGTPLAIGGAAIGAGMLANSPSAQAAIDGSISQSNPEFSGKQVLSEETEKSYRAPAWLKSPQEVGESALEGGMSALEKLDKYTARPARAGLLAALQERNPITAAKESITEDKDAEGGQIARELFKKFEQGGMPLRAPGQEEYPLEGILGTGIDFAADPTNLIGTGAATKAAKFLKTRKLVK